MDDGTDLLDTIIFVVVVACMLGLLYLGVYLLADYTTIRQMTEGINP